MWSEVHNINNNYNNNNNNDNNSRKSSSKSKSEKLKLKAKRAHKLPSTENRGNVKIQPLHLFSIGIIIELLVLASASEVLSSRNIT